VKPWLRWTLIGFVGVALLLGFAGYGYLDGWHIDRVSSADLSAKLRPHDIVMRPEGDGPFPAVILMHGCSGIYENNRTWAKLFVEQGYAAFIVNSLAPRGLAEREMDNGVCDGSVLWGSERAGDLLATLGYVRALPFVDPDQIVLAGWSHGGWTIMDAFALAAEDKVPTSLSDDAGGLDGVVAAILIYPYCGAFSVTYRTGDWDDAPPTLMLLAENDTMISTDDCLEVAEGLEADGQRLTTYVYPGVDHAFDYSDLPTDSRFPFHPEVTADAQGRVVAFLKEN
jgi:dienelactone hydrolase